MFFGEEHVPIWTTANKCLHFIKNMYGGDKYISWNIYHHIGNKKLIIIK